MIKLSSKFGLKNYIHNNEIVEFRRIYCGIGWPSSFKGSAVVLGEEVWNGQINYFLLAEVHADTTAKLISELQELHKRHRRKIDIDEYFGRQSPEIEQILTQHQVKAFTTRKPQLFVGDAVGTGNSITPHIETILNTLKPKILHLFKDSQVPAVLQSMPTNIFNVKNSDYPTIAALGYALTALVDFPYYDVSDIVIPSNNY